MTTPSHPTVMDTRPCPHCGATLEYISFGLSRAEDAWTGWIDSDGFELFACPACDGDLD